MEILYKLRLEIDGLIQLQFNKDSMNWRLDTSLRLAKSWTTKIIRILNPEENSLDVMILNGDSEEIKERQEPGEIEFMLISPEIWSKKSILERIEFFMTEIDKIIDQLPDYSDWFYNIKQSEDFIKTFCKPELPDWRLEIDQVYINLSEAKMFLGFELVSYLK